jgi:hypothetical protein
MTFWVAGAVVGSSVIGGIASSQAAKTQARAADAATQLQRDMFERQLELGRPWQEAGVNALAKLQAGDVGGYMDPSYQFRLGEGMKALERTAAARGGLLSGSAMREAQRYGQGLASTEYATAYNRLAAMAGLGQTAAQQLGTAGMNAASNIGAGMGAAAQARASGYMGPANALTGGLQSYLNYSQGQQLLNRMPYYGQAAPISASTGYDVGGLPSDYLAYNPV